MGKARSFLVAIWCSVFILSAFLQFAKCEIVCIDGMHIMSIVHEDLPPDFTTYVEKAITDNQYWKSLIEEKVGPITAFPWTRRIDDTEDTVRVFSEFLKTHSRASRESGKPFIILAHSWGTVLSYLAVQGSNDVYVDKFISLGSPLESQNSIAKSVSDKYVDQLSSLPGILAWQNYWAECDPISGSISFSHNIKISTDVYDGNIYLTCHASYFDDDDVWQNILLDVYLTELPSPPTIAMTPMSGPPGTTFVEWGTGCTPKSTATLYFPKYDGVNDGSAQQGIDSQGHFEINYPSGSNKPPGTYSWYAVDEPGVKSNTVTFQITPPPNPINPTIAMTPMSGPRGTTFVEWGTGFTPYGDVEFHFRKPDQTEYPTLTKKMDGIGHFEMSYTAPLDKPIGTHCWWGKDLQTGKLSNTVCFQITSPNPTTGLVSGRVHSGSSNGPVLSGASVACGGKSGNTGSDGRFSLSGVPSGSQTLSISKSGYLTYEKSVLITAGQNTDVGERLLVVNPVDPPSGGPDLAVHELKISRQGATDLHNSLTLRPGEAFSIDVWIKNRGETKATTQFVIKYMLSDDSEITSGDAVIGTDEVGDDVGSGNTYHDRKQNRTAPSTPGTYWIGAWVNSPQDYNKANDFSRGDGERGKLTVQAALSADLVLENQTISSGQQTFEATNSITAQNNFVVAGSADVTFHAGKVIYLNPGFMALEGSKFHAVVY